MKAASLLLLSFTAMSGHVSKDSMQTHAVTKQCAHIVILGLSGRDPHIVGRKIKEFRSKMPVLPVPPPCVQDSAATR